MIKLATFDVFDTCLIRVSGKPDTVFRQMAQRILKTCQKCDIMDFVKIRKEGERNAQNLAKGEISIEELYAQCDFSSLTQLSNKEIMSIEMDIERSVLIPVFGIKHKIDKLRGKGIKIGFISDMYLPSKFIKSVLEEAGLFKEGDLIYISSDSRMTKSSGKLYTLLKSEEKYARFGRWIHHGDNFRSDWINAIKAGAFARRIKHRYNDYENSDDVWRIPLIDRDIDISCSISRSLRLETLDNPRYTFALDVIAPIYVPFVWNVLSLATKKHISDLFFFARDGLIFYQIAQSFSSCFSNIQFHYVYVSRKSIYFPTITRFDKEEISSLFSKDEKSLARILAELCLTEEDIDSSELKKLKQLRCKNDIVDALFSNSDVRKIIREKYDTQRYLFLEYLKQESIARHSDDCAIVDLRGTRKSHERINKFLKDNEYNPVYGFYFEVVEDRTNPAIGNMFYSNIYREEFMFTPYYEALQNSTALFEQYFSITPHNRTSHYKINSDGVVVPVFDNEKANQERLDYYGYNLKACIKFASRYCSLVDVEHSEAISQFFLMRFLTLMRHPRHGFLKLLDGLKITENEFDNRVFVKRMTLGNISKYNIMWKKGSFAYTFGIWLWYLLSIKNNLRQWITSK